jgi:hypothetical protein
MMPPQRVSVTLPQLAASSAHVDGQTVALAVSRWIGIVVMSPVSGLDVAPASFGTPTTVALEHALALTMMAKASALPEGTYASGRRAW